MVTLTGSKGVPRMALMIFWPLPGMPLSAPQFTVFDSAAAQAGSLSTPSRVMLSVVVRAQMASARGPCAWAGSAQARAAPISSTAVSPDLMGGTSCGPDVSWSEQRLSRGARSEAGCVVSGAYAL
jgi:hypothetical protein